MKTLITGGAGFIGSHFVRRLASQGHDCIVLDALTYAGHRINLEGIKGNGSVELVVGNVCDGETVRKLIFQNQIESLFHFAAESHVDRSIDGPLAFIQTNVLGTAVLLHAALDYWRELDSEKKEKFKFVQISTDEVYGSLGDTGYFTENSPFAPNSPYSASKAGADHLARAWYHTYSFPVITTHCSNNYGSRQMPEKLIPRMITCALQEEPLPVYGDGKNIRDWIYVDDHCLGIELAWKNGKPGQSYCFGGKAEEKNIDLVRELCRILDEKTPRKNGKSYSDLIKFVDDRLGHDRRYAIDDTVARKELGFAPTVTFKEGLSKTVEWYLANQSWSSQVQEKTK